MRKCAGFLLGLTPLVLLLGASLADVVTVGPETAEVREEPATFATVVAEVHRGDELTVIEKRDEYYLVQLPDGRQGWIRMWYVNLEPGAGGTSGPSDSTPSGETQPGGSSGLESMGRGFRGSAASPST